MIERLNWQMLYGYCPCRFYRSE